MSHPRLLIQIGTYNTNLQAGSGLPQDLVDWIAPTFQVAQFLTKHHQKDELVAPDICVIAFQELLPLHQGLAGYAGPVMKERADHIRAEIEKHSPNKSSYTLIGKVVNVGVALLVFVRDDLLASRVKDVETSWTGCGPLWMGNKGAVGIRFRVQDIDGSHGEIFTFVGAHLTAHDHKLHNRIADYNHIVSSLLFSSPAGPSTIYDTSHLFFCGDLNFRISLPQDHPLKPIFNGGANCAETLSSDSNRSVLKDFDQLLIEKGKGTAFTGLHEGEFWHFKCSYKYKLGTVDQYSGKRTPAWTDRILYGTYTDDPNSSESSTITNLLYTSVPSYTTSDHKPVVSVLLLPPKPSSASSSASLPPLIRLPGNFQPTPDPHSTFKRYLGRTVDRIVGYTWWFMILIGAGVPAVGVFNFVVSLYVWQWWRRGGGGVPSDNSLSSGA